MILSFEIMKDYIFFLLQFTSPRISNGLCQMFLSSERFAHCQMHQVRQSQLEKE